jgi:hypothetical protein
MSTLATMASALRRVGRWVDDWTLWACNPQSPLGPNAPRR